MLEVRESQGEREWVYSEIEHFICSGKRAKTRTFITCLSIKAYLRILRCFQ